MSILMTPDPRLRRSSAHRRVFAVVLLTLFAAGGSVLVHATTPAAATEVAP